MLKKNRGFILADAIIGWLIICTGILMVLINYQYLNNQVKNALDEINTGHILLNQIREKNRDELITQSNQFHVKYGEKIETISWK